MISIFAKQAFLNVDPSHTFVYKGQKPKRGHMMRVSSIIRGDQIADRMGFKYNPETGYENDICIYVKPHLKKDNMDFKFEGRKSYLDIVDGHNLGILMRKYPDVGVIVCSQADYNTMSSVLNNKITLIPQHHCNFENRQRQSDEVKRIGIIGTKDAFEFVPDFLKDQFTKRNIELVTFSKFFTRQDVVDFYMSIDLQIVWRPYKKLLSNPLKLVNAASFGIPTIALDETAFRELDDIYFPVSDWFDFFKTLDKYISNMDLQKEYKEKCIQKAKEYHIDRIGELYKELDK